MAVEEHPCGMAAHRALPFLVDDDLAHGCNVRRDTTCVLSSDSEHLADVAADGRPAVEHLALGGSRRSRRTCGRRGRGLDGGTELEALDDLGAAHGPCLTTLTSSRLIEPQFHSEMPIATGWPTCSSSVISSSSTNATRHRPSSG